MRAVGGDGPGGDVPIASEAQAAADDGDGSAGAWDGSGGDVSRAREGLGHKRAKNNGDDAVGLHWLRRQRGFGDDGSSNDSSASRYVYSISITCN